MPEPFGEDGSDIDSDASVKVSCRSGKKDKKKPAKPAAKKPVRPVLHKQPAAKKAKAKKGGKRH